MYMSSLLPQLPDIAAVQSCIYDCGHVTKYIQFGGVHLDPCSH